MRMVAMMEIQIQDDFDLDSSTCFSTIGTAPLQQNNRYEVRT